MISYRIVCISSCMISHTTTVQRWVEYSKVESGWGVPQSPQGVCYATASWWAGPLSVDSDDWDPKKKKKSNTVNLEAMSSSGNVIARSSQPCMLRFNSLPIRLASIFIYGIVPFLLVISDETRRKLWACWITKKGNRKQRLLWWVSYRGPAACTCPSSTRRRSSSGRSFHRGRT